jgi:chromosome segregation ATPase
LEEAKQEEKAKYINQYLDLIQWLVMLYNNPRYNVLDEDVKHIATAFSWANKIDEYIDSNEGRLKKEREELEKKTIEKKKNFAETLEDISKEVEKFRELNDQRQEAQNNDNIAMLNKRLEECEGEMKEINEEEEFLGFPITEFPQIEELKIKLKPFEDLWKLFRDYKIKHDQTWENGPIFNLDPEEVEKDHKFMFGMAFKLNVKFTQMKLDKPAQFA